MNDTCPICKTAGVALFTGFLCENPSCRNHPKKISADESAIIERVIRHLWALHRKEGETKEEFRQNFFSSGGKIYPVAGDGSATTVFPDWLKERAKKRW